MAQVAPQPGGRRAGAPKAKPGQLDQVHANWELHLTKQIDDWNKARTKYGDDNMKAVMELAAQIDQTQARQAMAMLLALALHRLARIKKATKDAQ
jgi:hypothetical protein